MSLNDLLSSIWNQYIQVAPSALAINNLVREWECSPEIVNDHIALRTIKSESIGINSLSKHFLDLGYYKANCYEFKSKKLQAIHLEHEDKTLPKIFISEIDPAKLSSFAKNVCDEIINCSPNFKSPKDIYSGTHWTKIYKTYQDLYKESEYLAWFYCFGFISNHFTVSINHLKNTRDIHEVNKKIKELGYKLNPFGGEVKGTPADLLEQSSTMAEKITMNFSDGAFSVPSCFYEFAKRYNDKNGNLYHGFLSANADKIFESTKE